MKLTPELEEYKLSIAAAAEIFSSNFVKFYKSHIPKYGFCRTHSNCYSSVVIADSLEINGIIYTAKTSIKDLFTTYLSEVDKKKKAEKETQKLINKINDYQSNIN